MRTKIIALVAAFVVTAGTVQPAFAQPAAFSSAPALPAWAGPGSSDRDVVDLLGVRWIFELIPGLPAPAPAPAPVKQAAPAPAPAPVNNNVYYKNCDAVRAAGKAPLYRGQPGYEAPRLDRDYDGIACE